MAKFFLGFLLTLTCPLLWPQSSSGGKTKVIDAGEVKRILYVTGKPFYATGDGSTDDGPAIQAAIDSLPAAGGEIYFPEGTYPSDQVLIPVSNMKLIGAGSSSVIKTADAANIDLFEIPTGSTNITFRDLKLDGNRANQTEDAANIIWGSHVDNLTIDNVDFVDPRRRAIYLRKPLSTSDTSSGIKITNSRFSGSGKEAVTLVRVADVAVTDNSFADWGVVSASVPGFSMQENNQNVTFSHNIMKNTIGTQFGFEVTTPGDSGIGLDGGTIIGNIFEDDALGGSGVSGIISNSTMAQNIFRDGIGTHRSGFEVVGTHNIIVGNQIANGAIHYQNKALWGIKTFSSTDGIIAFNEISNNTVNGSAIRIGQEPTDATMTDVLIASNQIDMTGSTGSVNAIWLGFVGNTGKIRRVKVLGNQLSHDSNVGNGIRLNALAGSSNITIENNEVHGFAKGYTDDAVTNYDEVTVQFNDFRNNTTPIDHNATSGTFRIWGNVVK
jgi:hypothetical protein